MSKSRKHAQTVAEAVLRILRVKNLNAAIAACEINNAVAYVNTEVVFFSRVPLARQRWAARVRHVEEARAETPIAHVQHVVLQHTVLQHGRRMIAAHAGDVGRIGAVEDEQTLSLVLEVDRSANDG